MVITRIKIRPNAMLRIVFVFGAVLDATIAVSWFLIASGLKIPNILNGYMGSGADYNLAMYYSAMFMAGWAVLLAWGAIKPVERKGLLLITSGFLILSVIIELASFGNILGDPGFIFGVAKRLFVSLLFTGAYVYSLKVKS